MLLLFFLIFPLQLSISRSELIKDATSKPMEPFSASVDAGFFKKELQEDANASEEKITKLWFHRTHQQRTEISNFYNKNCCPVDEFGYYIKERCPLVNGLKDISNDSLDDLYSDSFLSAENLLGKTVYETITGKWKEVGGIEEIVCANDKEMKDRITRYYQAAYKDTIENQLATFRKDDADYTLVMQQYCWKGLCQDKKIKPEDAVKEAEALRAINPENEKDNFKKKLIELLDKNCEPDLKLIFEKYRKDNDRICDAVDTAFDVKRVRRAYNRLVRYIEDTCEFYADELHEAVHGAGTDTDKINRIVLTRCEQDLACILKKYEDKHGETFTKRLKTDTLGEPRYRESIRYPCGKQ